MIISLIDVETTGLEPAHHEIVDIGCVQFDSETLEVLNRVSLMVRPKHPEWAEPKALEINGYSDEEWEEKKAMNLDEAMAALKVHTDGTIFCAHNMILDWNFLRTAMAKTGIKIRFDHHRIDLFTLAYAKLPHDEMPDWSLVSICKHLGIIPESRLHRGLQGALKEYEVYCKLMG